MQETQHQSFTIQDFYSGVKLFNCTAGNTEEVNKEKLEAQQKLISEEAHKEALEAFAEDDAVKLLDSCIDGLYVLLGQLQKLELAGFDVQGAMKQVQEDNLSKFTEDEDVAIKSCFKYQNSGVEACYTKRLGKFVVLNSKTGKVLKPITFKSTDLSQYSPVKKISEIDFVDDFKKE